MTTPNPGSALWPADFQGCRIQAQYLDLLGAAISGSITFTATPSAILDQGHDIIVVPKVITATLDSTGSINIVVPATDDPDINPNGWTYAVSENFSGGRKYSIEAPQNTTIDLADASPVPSSNGAGIVRGPKGEAGGIQMVNGKTGDIITLSYADVGADQSGAAASVSANSLQRNSNLSDLSNKPVARTNLGLGTAATLPSTTFDLSGAATTAQNTAVAYTDANVPIGVIFPYVGTGAPIAPGDTTNSRWMTCQGQAVNRTTYNKLFAVIGTTYGVGDGSSTFNLPDLRESMIWGAGSVRPRGAEGGSITHNHTMSLGNSWAQLGMGLDGTIRFNQNTTSVPNYSTSQFGTLADVLHTSTGTINYAIGLNGATDTTTLLPPYVSVNFIIRVG